MRLNKFIARAGYTSRRKADVLIKQGLVQVNGKKVIEPYFQVNPQKDLVKIKEKTLYLDTKPLYLMLNKPLQVVTSLKDEQGRKTVLDLLPKEIQKKRPFPVGRLDFFSEGLLILTTDGELCYRLTHPKYKIPKTYLVKVRGEDIENKLKIMQRGMLLKEGDRVLPAKIKVVNKQKDFWQIELTITQGLNRQIRRMCRDVELTLLQLKRIKIGPLALTGLPPGKFRNLTPKELSLLFQAVGLKK